MKNIKLFKVIVYVLVILIVALLGLLVIIILNKQVETEVITDQIKEIKEKEPVKGKPIPRPSSSKKDLAIYDIENVGESDIIGKIKNDTGRKIDYLEIKGTFYNNENQRIFEDFDITSDLEPNEVWIWNMYIQKEYESVKFKTTTNPLE